MAILTSKVVNLTYYNLKEGQFKVILTLKVVILTFKMVIFDLKVIKNGFGKISDFRILDFKNISDFEFGISELNCINKKKIFFIYNLFLFLFFLYQLLF